MGYFWLAVQAAKGLMPAAVSVISRIPLGVWLAGAAVVGVLLYGHEVAKRTAAAKDLEYSLKIQTEVMRQASVADAVVEQEKKAALAAQTRVEELDRSLKDANMEMQKWKDRARICVPANVTDKLRHNSEGRSRSKPSGTPLRLSPLR